MKTFRIALWTTALICIWLFSARESSAQGSVIWVSGDITQDSIWDVDTVKVDGTVTVDRYSTLTIAPGTYVEFQGYYSLAVSGKLEAIGNEAESITFTINDSAGFFNLTQPDGAWHGIRFDNRYHLDTSILEFCIIEFGKAINGDWNNIRGGGIWAGYESKLIVSNCTIRNNHAEYGGGIYLYQTNAAIISHNRIVNNTSSQAGGGLQSRDNEPVIINNIICNNKAIYGGGIRFTSCDAILANNLIYNNEAMSIGGGIFMQTTDLVSINNTICYNKTYGNASIGGGIYVDDQSKPVFYNNIIWGNLSVGDGNQVYLYEFNPDIDFYNCNIQDGQDNLGLQLGSVYFGDYLSCIDTLPGFTSPPADTGIIADPLGVDLALELGSRCINRGTNTAIQLYPLATDIVNNRRVSYSDIDIGAYEFYRAYLDACGNIDENTTWTADTIKVNCDIDILDTYTLVINPGALVQFQGPYRIEVHGTLLALGSETDSIIFTINDTTGFSDIGSGDGGWRGIEFYSFASNDSSKILYSRLEYSKRISGPGYDEYGGAILAASCYRLLISNSTITNNMSRLGGAMRLMSSPITIRNSTISYNRSIENWAGGIACHTSNATITGCNISYNSTPDNGGGITAYRCEPNISNCTISNNTAEGQGGGLYSWYDSRPILTGNIISHNTAGSGGGFYVENAAYLSKNLISNNKASSAGGFIAYADEEFTLVNNIISNNQSEGSYGAFTLSASSIKFMNNTIVNNRAETNYGGFFIDSPGSILENSIIWGNTSGNDASQIYVSGTVEHPEIIYSNIQDGIESINFNGSGEYPGRYENNIDSLPLFVQPTDSAGINFDGVAADWLLLATSLSVNAGNPATDDPDVLPTDLQGNPRINMSVIDLGALENQSGLPVITEQPLNYTKCTGDSVRFSIEVTGDVFYQWQMNQTDIPGATQSSYLIDSITTGHDGNYQCIIRNAYAVLKSNPALLRVKSPPEILLQPENTWVEINEEAILRVIAAGTDPEYQWRKDELELPGKIVDELSILNSGYEHEGSYDCVISNVCGTDTTESVNVFLVPQICMVTVDSTTGLNLVVWEKKSIAPLMAYNVYRESVAAGIYDRLVTMSFDELSVFVDTLADPTAQAYLYKITAIDTAGNETDIDLCRPHKTIHLLVSTNPELNTTQLAWDRYYGFEYQTYTIYRSSDGASFDSIHSISANLNSWTDPDPADGDLYYRIAVRKPDPCYPEGGDKKAGTGPYNHSLSNLDDNKLRAGENPPDTIRLNNHFIDENMLPGSLVGRLITDDADTLDSHSYHFVSGDGDGDNDSFTLLGDLLLAAESFDFESKNSYTIRVVSVDLAQNTISNVFVISITDVDETVGLEQYQDQDVKVYPNPFSHSTTVVFPNPEGNPYRLYLMNLSGKIVRAETGITTPRFYIERGDLENGIYFIELRGPKIYRGKLVVE